MSVDVDQPQSGLPDIGFDLQDLFEGFLCKSRLPVQHVGPGQVQLDGDVPGFLVNHGPVFGNGPVVVPFVGKKVPLEGVGAHIPGVFRQDFVDKQQGLVDLPFLKSDGGLKKLGLEVFRSGLDPVHVLSQDRKGGIVILGFHVKPCAHIHGRVFFGQIPYGRIEGVDKGLPVLVLGVESGQGDAKVFPFRMIRYQLCQDLFRLIPAIRSLVKAHQQQSGLILFPVLLDKDTVGLFGLIPFLVFFQDLRQEDPSGLVLGIPVQELPEKSLCPFLVLAHEADICKHDVGIGCLGIFRLQGPQNPFGLR